VNPRLLDHDRSIVDWWSKIDLYSVTIHLQRKFRGLACELSKERCELKLALESQSVTRVSGQLAQRFACS
jgi:hypothetical protein